MDRDLLPLSDELFERWSGLFREVRQRIADGRPVDSRTRATFSRVVGRDPEGVLIHTGSFPRTLATAMRADAITVAGRVFGDETRLNPDTMRGMGLLAHETSHALDQGAFSSPTMMHRPTGRAPDSHPFDQASEPASSTAGPDGPMQHQSEATPQTVQRITPSDGEHMASEIEGQVQRKPAPASAGNNSPEVIADIIYRRIVDEILLLRDRSSW